MLNYGTILNYGDIVYVDFEGAKGSEQGGVRPAVILSNNIGNKYSPTVQVAPLTSQWKKNIPVHVLIDNNEKNGLSRQSTILIEQTGKIDKQRIIEKIGTIDDIHVIKQINNAVAIQFNLPIFSR